MALGRHCHLCERCESIQLQQPEQGHAPNVASHHGGCAPLRWTFLASLQRDGWGNGRDVDCYAGSAANEAAAGLLRRPVDAGAPRNPRKWLIGSAEWESLPDLGHHP
jgi:hypothetical protein